MNTISNLQTPCLVLDRGKVAKNIARMQSRANGLGVPLRPHGKTPKNNEVAKMLMEAGAIGLTTSTLAETEGYFAGGINDIFYAVPLSADKVARIAALQAGGLRINCLVDHPDAAHQIIAEAERLETIINLIIEIDVDAYRTGIRLDNPAFVEMARSIHQSASAQLKGIMSYGGASYGCNPTEAGTLAENHRLALMQAKEKLSEYSFPCEVVSFGSSPATLHAHNMDGVTELRCGIYIFQDLFQAAIGACAIDDIALSVLATVISHKPELNRIIVDAGGLAMSKDLSTARTSQDAGYGLICDADTGDVLADIYMPVTSQELGLISTLSGKSLPFDQLPIGSKLRILPNHADMTAAAYPGYHVVDGSDKIWDYWERHNGW